MNKIILACLLATLFSCNSEPVDKIVGTYAREFTYEQKNLSTEKILGIATIRDTIFITKKKEGYQVENAKWLKNDYDNEGWRDQSHADSRPFPPFTASFDDQDETLNPHEPLIASPLYIDLEKGLVSKSKNRENVWKKVKP